MIEITNPSPAATSPQPRKDYATAKSARAIGQGLINLALIIWAVRDIRRRHDDEIKGNRKIWLLAAFAPPIGPIAYFVFGRKRRTTPAEIPLEITE